MDTPANPIIIETDANKKNRSFANKTLAGYLPKLLFAALIATIIVEISIGIYTLSKPLPASLPAAKTSELEDAKLSLVSKKTVYKVGDNIPVQIRLNTGGHSVTGADAIVRFNKNYFSASSSGILKGNLFSEYPLIRLDSSTGTIEVSGLSTKKDLNFNGMGIFATINLVALKEGSATVLFDFVKNRTDDSNVLDQDTSQDVLGEVVGLGLTLQR